MMSLTFGLFTQVSGSGPLGPLVFFFGIWLLLLGMLVVLLAFMPGSKYLLPAKTVNF